MFSFTSIGGYVNIKVEVGKGPYVYRFSGQNYHKISSLLPIAKKRASFTQLYIYDIENEIDNKIRSFGNDVESTNIDREIVNGLTRMLDQNNAPVKSFGW